MLMSKYKLAFQVDCLNIKDSYIVGFWHKKVSEVFGIHLGIFSLTFGCVVT